MYGTTDFRILLGQDEKCKCQKVYQKVMGLNPQQLCLVMLFLLVLIFGLLPLLPENQSEFISEGNRNVHTLTYLLTVAHVL